MLLSRQADFAVRVVLDLATLGEGPIREVARRQSVSPAYVGRISQSLVRAGLVRSQRGRLGRLALARSPEEITMLDVIEAVDGPIRVDRCLLAPGECGRELFCPAYPVGQSIIKYAVDRMGSTTVADLCWEGSRAKKLAPQRQE
jgi:Rrf2 family protein